MEQIKPLLANKRGLSYKGLTDLSEFLVQWQRVRSKLLEKASPGSYRSCFS